MAIGNRIQECIEKLNELDGENAFIQLSIAIDGTSKKLYPKSSTSSRCKGFIKENLPFVFWSLTNGTPSTCECLVFELQINEISTEISLEDVMYKLLRCNLLHEGNLPEIVSFTNNEYIAVDENGKLILPLGFLWSYVFAVICSPVNYKETLKQNNLIKFGTEIYDLNKLWGKESEMRQAIRYGFQFDVEKMLEMLDKGTH